MRPFGPEPVTPARSTPLSAAMRRASGLALTREPAAAAGWAGAGVGVGAGALAAGVGAGAGAGVGLGAGAAAADETSSPSPAITAITVPTFTLSVPSATRIFPITPSSTASNSIVALSVSISASRSPDFTVSPSLTSHLASVPSSMVGESAGILISIPMKVPVVGPGVACPSFAAVNPRVKPRSCAGARGGPLNAGLRGSFPCAPILW